MKRHILKVVRRSGLLRQADHIMLWRGRARAYLRNRRFAREHPDVPMPPDELAFDAFHHVDRIYYHEIGRRHAAVFANAIAAALPQHRLDVLEWGCGPGRLIRHMRACLPDREVTLTGTDLNERSIAWCRQHLPEIDFVPNRLQPPLDFADARFDAVYCYSVFTHLSEEAQLAWAAELHRVLRPGGILVCTTQGKEYLGQLAVGEELERFEASGLVVQGQYEEGKKWFLALNSPQHVRNQLLAAFEDIQRVPVPEDAALKQDVWAARKPAA